MKGYITKADYYCYNCNKPMEAPTTKLIEQCKKCDDKFIEEISKVKPCLTITNIQYKEVLLLRAATRKKYNITPCTLSNKRKK